jgi:hypothetical protein
LAADFPQLLEFAQGTEERTLQSFLEPRERLDLGVLFGGRECVADNGLAALHPHELPLRDRHLFEQSQVAARSPARRRRPGSGDGRGRRHQHRTAGRNPTCRAKPAVLR